MKLGRTIGLLGLLTAYAIPVHAGVEWFGSAQASATYSSTSAAEDDDEEGSSASSLGLRGMIGFESTDSRGSTRVEASSRQVSYQEDGRRDRFSNEIELRRRFDIAPQWLVDLTASAASNLWTVESPFADQWQGRGRVTYQPDGRVRLRGYVGYIKRYYDDPGRTQADGFQIGGDFRRRVGKGSFDVDVDHLSVSADDSFYDNQRTTFTAAYSRELTRKLEGSVGLRARRVLFEGRPANPLTGLGEREDWSVRPEVSLTYKPSDPVEMSLHYRYTRRDSNDNQRDREDQSVGMRLTYRF